MELSPKTALVTGAASGIGRATAVILAESGYRVLCSDISAEGAEKVAKMVPKGSQWMSKSDQNLIQQIYRVGFQLWHKFGRKTAPTWIKK